MKNFVYMIGRTMFVAIFFVPFLVLFGWRETVDDAKIFIKYGL